MQLRLGKPLKSAYQSRPRKWFMVLASMELNPCHTWAHRGKRAAKLEMRGHYLPLHPYIRPASEAWRTRQVYAAVPLPCVTQILLWLGPAVCVLQEISAMEQRVSNEITRLFSPFNYHGHQAPIPTPKTRHGLVGCTVFHLKLST